jgi:homoserine kinase type II
MQGFPPPPGEPRPRYSPQNVLAVNETLVQRDVLGDLSDTLAWYDGRAARLRKQLADKDYRALPHLAIHGDVHSDNVLFAGNDVVALLDFDQVEWDTPLSDIADALVAFASVARSKVTGANWGVFPGVLDVARAELLMAGYASVRSLSPREVEILPLILEILWLQGEMGRVHNTPEGAPEYHLSVLDQGLGLSYWLNEHRDELVEKWKAVMADPPAKHQRRSQATAA